MRQLPKFTDEPEDTIRPSHQPPTGERETEQRRKHENGSGLVRLGPKRYGNGRLGTARGGKEELRAHDNSDVTYQAQGMTQEVTLTLEFQVIGSLVFTWVGSPSGNLAAGTVQGTQSACSSMFTNEPEDTIRPSHQPPTGERETVH